ncbi:hypothetical protein PVAND_014708 [Polypedilum vanderplanki]|uniref:Reverse transcriptase domain-containing protein n=1 Tax=Polypedilum vanderplanki TaxID=319348 RepID=A0A9J6BAH7_POLVA|nr:hypothetical protein PVAND_014708 [Polypedilum vanderplanki]
MSKDNYKYKKDKTNNPIKFSVTECIAITETWLNEGDKINRYNIKNYNNFHLKRRIGKRGGGISLYVKKNWNLNIIDSNISNNVEYLLAQINNDQINRKLLIIYRPPSGNIASFLSWLDQITSSHPDLILAGDMNINIADIKYSAIYVDLLNSNGYDIINESITRNESKSIIDHICISERTFEISCKVIEVYTMMKNNLSDHNMLVLVAKSCNSVNWTKTSIKKINYNAIINEISSENKDVLSLESESKHEVLNKFQNLICNIKFCIDTHTEVIELKHNANFIVPPWIDNRYVKIFSHIDNLSSKIEKLKFQNRPFTYLSTKQDELKKKLKNIDQNRGRAYYLNKMQSGKMSAWDMINQITGRNKDRDKIILKTCNGQHINEPHQVANKFAKYFNNLIQDQSNSVEPIYLGPIINSCMFLTPVTEAEICFELKELAINKATGYDGIPARIWKSLYSSHATILTLSKIFEKVLCKRILSFLEHTESNDPTQFGFKKKKSTADAVIKLLSSVSNALDRQEVVISIFIDVKKAFDTVDHEIVLFKAEKLGVRGLVLEILRDYLKNRSQFVMINDQSSDTYRLVQGVPQGSILGPLLFNILISDIQYLKLNSKLVQYADDLSMTYSNLDTSILKLALKHDFIKLKDFYVKNGMQINETKTKMMCFHVASNCRLQVHAKSLADDLGIELVNHFKYLGVILDSKLKFNLLIEDLSQKVKNSIKALSIIKSYAPMQCRLAFYNAFINSHLLYFAFILIRAPKTGLKRLQILQNKGLKICFMLPPLYDTVDLFTSYAVNILPLNGQSL